MLKELFLQKFNEQSFRPCRLFIVTASFKDGLTIYHAAGETPEDAWAVANKNRRGGGVIRIEFVTSSRRVTWADCLREIRANGTNRFPHGIACDKDWRLALTEQELNELLKPLDAAQIPCKVPDETESDYDWLFSLDEETLSELLEKQDAPKNSYNVLDLADLQEYCRRRFDCDLPNLDATDEVEVFDTIKIFFQADMSEPAINIPPLRVGVLQEDKNKGKKPYKLSAIGLMTYMAKNFNIELYFFTSHDIDFDRKIVNATLIEGQNFVNKVISLPKIIYNIPEAISGSDKNKNLKLRLEKDGCHFIRPVLSLSKQTAYDMLLNNTLLKEFLIETHTIKNFENFLVLFKEYHNDVILKPVLQAGGYGVSRITFADEKYCVNVRQKRISFNSVDEFKSYYTENFTDGEWILQPYINSRTKTDNPFDVRVYIARIAEDNFKSFIYARIGNAKGVISNLHGGGHAVYGERFLKDEFGDDWKILYDRLNYLGNIFPEYFQSFFKEKFFAIALDVGIQRRNNSYDLKIFEVNSRSPGMGFLAREAAFASLEYLRYLGKNLDKENM